MTGRDNGKMKFTLLKAAVIASCYFENKNFASLFCKSLCTDRVPLSYLRRLGGVVADHLAGLQGGGHEHQLRPVQVRVEH